MPPPLHILILAAGASSRMGGADKLTELVGGQPLLRVLASRAMASQLPVTVALPADRPLREAALAGLGVHCITVADARHGMAHSLRAGLGAIPSDAAVMLLLADLPEITTQDLAVMAGEQGRNPDQILRATDATQKPGHPVIFPPWVRAELLALAGDDGARAVLQRHKDRVTFVTLPGRHATTDLDTPEDWAAWRSGQQ